MSEDTTPQVTPTTPAEPSEAVANAQAEAKANSKAEGTPQAAQKLEDQRNDNLESARKTAQINHDAGDEAQPEQGQTELKNDTSKRAKVDTSKSQLDPTGTDPNVSKAENERAATDGVNVHGGTSVTDEEQARRAQAGNNDDGELNKETADAAGNPTLGNGEINPPADTDAVHPGGGKADGSASSASSDSADKS